MKGPWKFLLGLLAGFLLALGVTYAAFCFGLGTPTATSRWAFEVMQKKRTLAARAEPPRLLVVGGSSSLFGVSAKEIEQETGCHTINLGCHAALGVSYILYETRRVAKPGDTVLLVLEYELYNYGKLNRSWADMLLLDYIVARDPEYYFHGLTLPEQWNVFMFTPNARIRESLQNRSRAEGPATHRAIYNPGEVNDWGDQTHHTKSNQPTEKRYVLDPRSILAYGLSKNRKQAFETIKAFSDWAQANRIRVVATFPNLCDHPEYHGPAAKQVAQTIKDSFARLKVPVIGDYADTLFPADQCFDTFYHLTEEASLARTQNLITQLRPYLK